MPLSISGLKHMAVCNGIYEPTEERRRGAVIYRMRGGGDMWLVLTKNRGKVQSGASKDADKTNGFVWATGAMMSAASPLDVPQKDWQEWDGSSKKCVHTAGTRVERVRALSRSPHAMRRTCPICAQTPAPCAVRSDESRHCCAAG